MVAMYAAGKLNDKTLNLVKEFEGWSSCAYFDVAGKLTIGYGHLIKPGEPLNKDSCITKEFGQYILIMDLFNATKCIERSVSAPLTDNQLGALSSWAFNVGCGAATNSTLVKKLNAGSQANEICDELRRWNKITINGTKQVSPGLVKRREGECTLYKTPDSEQSDHLW